ncbi:hypothetical protein JOD52_003297 [Brachybacterium muris]|uniref:DMT family transporter n=1 Tax=Brachybacterium muris TaxID=219301 RepID=UPI0030B8A710|nr:hypothetical protein [Brachybacterium muris]
MVPTAAATGPRRHDRRSPRARFGGSHDYEYSLRAGMPLGVAYGVWTAAGVALTAIFSRVIHKEPMTPLMIAGIVMIGAGVLLIELGAGH